MMTDDDWKALIRDRGVYLVEVDGTRHLISPERDLDIAIPQDQPTGEFLIMVSELFDLDPALDLQQDPREED